MTDTATPARHPRGTPETGLRVGSLFSGIGGFDLAADRVGATVAWQCEIDPACRQVLAHHWPNVPCYPDVTTLDPNDLEPVDVITFGSPCQDLSVAGQRAGLAGARSGLYFDAIRIIAAVRPTFALWENVPGALSSRGGRDFYTALCALADIGALDIGWAILDAQWWGVAQRRRRLFVVADFRGQRAGQILALADGLRGDSPPSRTPGQGVTPLLEIGARTNGDGYQDGAGIGQPGDPMFALQAGHQHGIAGTVSSKWAKGTGGPSGDETQNLVAHTLSSEGADASEDGTGRGTPLVVCQNGSDIQVSDMPGALTAGMARQTSGDLVAFTNRGIDTGGGAETLRAASHGAIPMVAATLTSNGDAQNGHRLADGLVTFDERNITSAANRTRVAPGLPVPTLHGAPGMSVASQMQVRRLTPTECERLQGFPDGWTDGHSDSARYRMLGNAVAVPVVTWLLNRTMTSERASPRRTSEQETAQ